MAAMPHFYTALGYGDVPFSTRPCLFSLLEDETRTPFIEHLLCCRSCAPDMHFLTYQT